MKSIVHVFFLIVLFLTALPAAEAQSTLNFVRQFQPSELQTTGFAVANPSAMDADVTFTLYSDAGATVSLTTQTVLAGGQYAKLGSELFPGSTTGGWVQATSSAPGLTGFWLSGDFATYTDGAEAAVVAKTLVLPIATENMEISVANPSGATNNVRIRLIAPNGADAASAVTQSVAPLGVFQAQASVIFPGAPFSDGMYLLLSGDTGFSASSVVRSFLVPTESAVLNAVEGSTSGAALYFPHVISGTVGGANYTTVIGVTNLVSSSQTITLTFNPEPVGVPIVVQRSLPPLGSLRESAQSIFGAVSGFRDGWVKVSGSQNITGFVAYGDTVSGGLAVVPPQATPRASMLFAHVAGLPTWYTGLALLNASDTNASIEISVLNPAGELIGNTVKFDLSPKHKTARLLGDLVPEANSQNGGFVIVRSSVPLFGLQLFGGTNGKILSNIASGRPAPSTSSTTSVLNTSGLGRVTLNSIEWDTTAPHGCATVSGSGCFVPQPGTKILRVRFDLLDRTAASIGQNEAIGIYLSVTLSGSNFGAISPALIGAVQPPPVSVDTYVIITSGFNFAVFTAPSAPPYGVVYMAFQVPMNATGMRLAFSTTAVMDLGF